VSDFLTEKEKAKEKIFEALLEYAGSCHVENIVNEIQEQSKLDEQISFPPELDVKMRKFIAQYSRREKLRKVWENTQKIFPKVAVFVVVTFTCMTIFVMNVEALRLRALNFIVDETKKYTSIEIKEDLDILENNSNTIPPDWEGLYAPTYIPEGFRIVQAQNLPETSRIIYSNDIKQTIIFDQSSNEKTNFRIDTENAKTSKIMINGFGGLLIEKDNLVIIVWYNDEVSFTLTGKIDINELLEIAESVQVVK